MSFAEEKGAVLYTLSGVTGDLELHHDHIVIRQKEMVFSLTPGATEQFKTIPLSCIKKLRFDMRDMMVRGLIYLAIHDIQDRVTLLAYSQKQHPIALKIKEKIDRFIKPTTHPN